MRSQITLQMGLGVLLVAGATSLATSAHASGDNKDMVLIPKGEFTMGSNEHSDEVRHQVVLDAYLIDKFEASDARYKEFMRATGHPAPAYWDDPRLSKPEQPVVGVSWTDANAFCKWDGKRLPTEAEWEKAARGEGKRRYAWGEEFVSGYANIDGTEDGFRYLAPPGSFESGRSPYGIYDMTGNVGEWVADAYDENFYRASPYRDPKGPDQGEQRIVRLGSELVKHDGP